MITEQKIVDRMDAYRARLSALIERLKRYPETIRACGNTYELSYGDTYVSLKEGGMFAFSLEPNIDEFEDARVDDVDSLIALKNAITRNEKDMYKIHHILDEYDAYRSKLLRELEDFFN